jgi:hypothetical protein
MTPVKASPWSSTAQHCRRHPCPNATRGQKPANLARACAPSRPATSLASSMTPSPTPSGSRRSGTRAKNPVGVRALRRLLRQPGILSSVNELGSPGDHTPAGSDSLRRSDERAFEDLAITPQLAAGSIEIPTVVYRSSRGPSRNCIPCLRPRRSLFTAGEERIDTRNTASRLPRSRVRARGSELTWHPAGRI